MQAHLDIDVLNREEAWAPLARRPAVKSVERRLGELADALVEPGVPTAFGKLGLLDPSHGSRVSAK